VDTVRTEAAAAQADADTVGADLDTLTLVVDTVRTEAAAAQADADTGRAKGDSGISIGSQARDTANQALADASTAQDTANAALTAAGTAQDGVDSTFVVLPTIWFQEAKAGQWVIPAAGGPALTQTDRTNFSDFTMGFDPGTDESASWSFSSPGFINTDTHDSINFTFYWLGDTSVLDTVKVHVDFIPRGTGTAYDTTLRYGGFFYAINGGNGKVNVSTATFTTASLGPNDWILLRVRRDANDAHDTYPKDCLVLGCRVMLYR
jgi:hypothetical protein